MDFDLINKFKFFSILFISTFTLALVAQDVDENDENEL